MHSVYICPMHPEIHRDRPGLCPECGMSLVLAKLSAEAHGDKHAGHSTADFAKKFWASLLLTIPVVLAAFGVLDFAGAEYVSWLLASAVFFYGGWIFISGGVMELKAARPGMMTLIGLAVTTAYLYSAYAVLAKTGEPLFWELTTLITVMLLGHWLEMKAVQSARGSLEELSKLLPETAEVIHDDKTETIPLENLRVGDLVLVKPGGRIPADGQVVEGQSEVNESMMTGESAPVSKTVGSQVVAGTINGDGALKIKVTKIGEETFLAGVVRLVTEAEASKSKLQLLSDQAAFYLTLIAVASGALTFVIWFFAGAGPSFALERLVAVLVIACPHALGLAVPLVASISTTLAARRGFLVRRRLALESARKIDVVLFDKTGTLTKGEYVVESVEGGNEVLRLAAAVDQQSEHFAARAILAEAKKRGWQLPAVSDFKRLAGKGASAKVENKSLLVGGEGILDEVGLGSQRSPIAGKTVIYVVADGKLIGRIILADAIREESRQAVSELKKMGIKTAMITGDTEEVARWVAEELKISEYFARVLPQDKVNIVKKLQTGIATPMHDLKFLKRKSGSRLYVGMVGDGINDAPALVQADLGVAIGAGTNIAIESAGIILVKNDPRDVAKIISLSRATYAKMLQNLFWATAYNIVALPLAAGVLANQGFVLQPALSALFMSLSTVIVAINALFLRKLKL